jgi:5'(3')-deoxyribonucleotidase
MRVLVDMDEVVCDFVGEFVRRVGRKREEVVTFDVNDCLGITRERFLEVISDPSFFRSLEPIDGALDGLKRIVDAGHDLVICTMISTGCKNAYDAKANWLCAHLPWMDVDRTMITAKRKSLVRGDVLFDDNMKNLEHFPGAAVAMARPWNEGFRVRVKTWPEFTRHVDYLHGVMR